MQVGRDGNRRRNSSMGLVAVLAIVVAACSSPLNGAGESTTAGESASTTDDASSSSVVDNTSTSTSTTTSTTSTTTTTLPPRPQVSATESVLASSFEVGVPKVPVDVVVKPGDTVARMALNSIAEGKRVASIGAIETTSFASGTPLVVEGASDIRVDDLAANADKVVASGSVVDAESKARAVYWESPDGATFGPATVLPDALERSSGVALLDGGIPVVVGWSQEPRPSQIVVVRRADDGSWLPTTLVPDANAYGVDGIAASGQTVIVTGSYDRGRDGQVGVVWASNDSGATFQEIKDGLDSVAELGRPIMTPSGFVAVGNGRGNDPSRLFISPDGFTWNSLDISLTSADNWADTVPRYVGDIALNGDRLVFGLGATLLDVATIGLDGRGSVAKGPDRDSDEVYWNALPYVLDGRTYVVALSQGGYRLAAEQNDRTWTLGAQSGTGPIASGVEFGRLRSGAVANASVYPVVETTPDGGVRWYGESTWNVNTDTGWAVADEATIPSRTQAVEASSAADLALAVIDLDPDDDDRPGPAGGTAALVRTDAAWSEPVPIATGPGGENVFNTAPLGTGFVAVGFQAARTESAETLVVPLIREYVDGAWNTIPAPDGVPAQTNLFDVATSGDGDVLAVGNSEAAGTEGAVFLARDPAGAWSVVASPIEGQSTDILSMAGSDTAIDLLVREDASWFHYVYDNGAFTRSPINFDGADSPRPSGLVALNGTTYLVGSGSGDQANHLAVWELSGETATSVGWSAPVVDMDLVVSDVIVSNGRLFAGGVKHGQDVVWELTISLV